MEFLVLRDDNMNTELANTVSNCQGEILRAVAAERRASKVRAKLNGSDAPSKTLNDLIKSNALERELRELTAAKTSLLAISEKLNLSLEESRRLLAFYGLRIRKLPPTCEGIAPGLTYKEVAAMFSVSSSKSRAWISRTGYAAARRKVKSNALPPNADGLRPGLSIRALCKKFKVGHLMMKQWCQEHGYAMTHVFSVSKTPKTCEGVEPGLSIVQVAARFNVSYGAAQDWVARTSYPFKDRRSKCHVSVKSQMTDSGSSVVAQSESPKSQENHMKQETRMKRDAKLAYLALFRTLEPGLTADQVVDRLKLNSKSAVYTLAREAGYRLRPPVGSKSTCNFDRLPFDVSGLEPGLTLDGLRKRFRVQKAEALHSWAKYVGYVIHSPKGVPLLWPFVERASRVVPNLTVVELAERFGKSRSFMYAWARRSGYVLKKLRRSKTTVNTDELKLEGLPESSTKWPELPASDSNVNGINPDRGSCPMNGTVPLIRVNLTPYSPRATFVWIEDTVLSSVPPASEVKPSSPALVVPQGLQPKKVFVCEVDGKSFPFRSRLLAHVQQKYPGQESELMAKYPATRRPRSPMPKEPTPPMVAPQVAPLDVQKVVPQAGRFKKFFTSVTGSVKELFSK